MSLLIINNNVLVYIVSHWPACEIVIRISDQKRELGLICVITRSKKEMFICCIDVNSGMGFNPMMGR